MYKISDYLCHSIYNNNMDLMWQVIIAVILSLVIFGIIAIITGDMQNAFMGSGGLKYG